MFCFRGMKDVDQPEADEKVEIGGLQADALADFGRPADPLVEMDDRGNSHWLFLAGQLASRSGDAVRSISGVVS